MTRVLAVAALVACAPQLRPQPLAPPAPPAPSVEAHVEAPAATQSSASTEIPREGESLEQPDVVEFPGFERSTPDPVRCPAPYAGEDGWVPKEEVGAEQARSMNERVGLICSERTRVIAGDPWVREEFWERATRAGCTDERGRIVIPFIYLELTPFAESGLALALHPDDGWVYIDRRHRRLGKALAVDNMPDEVFGGHARFQAANGKIGYLDRARRIVIPARYDDAFPFNRCRAVVCVGCHPLRWSEDAPEEAACSGDLFLIDESGKRLESLAGPDWVQCGEKQKAP